jgi:hypothetical protein
MADKTDPSVTSLPATGKTGKPALMDEFNPSVGGYDGASVESAGEVGDKGVGVESEFSKATEEGDYNHAKIGAFGAARGWPATSPNPDNLEGPPPGSTDGGPNHSNY